MARNLRAKIPASDTLLVCDANPETTARFIAETENVKVASGPRELAEQSVLTLHIYARTYIDR